MKENRALIRDFSYTTDTGSVVPGEAARPRLLLARRPLASLFAAPLTSCRPPASRREPWWLTPPPATATYFQERQAFMMSRSAFHGSLMIS